MMGSGGMIVMDEDNCMVDIAPSSWTSPWTSCGKCTPCRIGTRRMLEILNRICEGKGEDGDIEAGAPGRQHQGYRPVRLGQTAPNPVLSTILRLLRQGPHLRQTVSCAALLCSPIAGRSLVLGCTLCARVCPQAPSWAA